MMKTNQKNNVHIVFLIYWCVLVVWQNISGSSNRSGMDLLIKLALIITLSLYCFFHTNRYVGRNFLYLVAFAIFLSIPFMSVEQISSNIMISYLFPCLFIFLTFVLGDKYEINKRQLITFFNVVIFVVVYMAIYAIIFCSEQFLSAFSLSSAYGHELSSFLPSNHEYGLYLVGGITGCFICLHLKRHLALRQRFPYIVALIFFIPNLILTYSRTSIFGMACILVIYVILSDKNKLKRVIIGVLTGAVVVVCSVPALRSFFMLIVFKNNNLAGRDTLSDLAIEFFRTGSVFKKLFGHGITESRIFFEQTTSHGSVHNAYLQILIYFGVIIFGFMIVFLISQLYANIKLYQKEKFWGAVCIAVLVMCICVMFVNTAYIFNSLIDSYFLTIISIIIPKYVRNSINAGTFDIEVGD